MSRRHENADLRVLGTAALGYVRTQLSMGGPFARLLLDHISAMEGSVYALVPVGLGVSDDTNFGNAIIPAEPHSAGWVKVQTLEAELARFVQEFLQDDDERVCVFEDASATKGAPFLERAKSRLMYSDADVYHVALCEDVLSRVEDTIRSATSWLTIAALATSATTAATARAQKAAEPSLVEVVTGVSHVIVGAFDGEGYLVWSSTT